MKGLDISFAQPTPAWWASRRAEGFQVVVQNAWTGVAAPAGTRTNLYNARNAGFITAAYLCTNLLAGATSVQRAQAACGDEWAHLNFIAVDVEISGIAIPTLTTNTRAAINALAGKKVCLYTAWWFWVGHMGNSEAFKDVPLWNADYDADAAMDFPRRYGGWTEVIGKQYAGTTVVDGQAVDLNTFSDSFIGGDMALTEADKTIVKQIIELYIKHDAPLFKDNVNHLIRAANIPRDQADAALKARVDGHVADTAKHAGGKHTHPLSATISGATEEN